MFLNGFLAIIAVLNSVSNVCLILPIKFKMFLLDFTSSLQLYIKHDFKFYEIQGF